ncbi:MAG: RidA family protein [Phycisphaeraceae bacterium]|nr:RidA family protein [Phycisphaeraceae bacterium]MCW5762947.1 RidA family protein [Phycisphaeraceae bacterium]
MKTPYDPESSLASLGLTLPAAPKPVAAYIPWVRSGNLLYVSGQIPFVDGSLLLTGPLPDAGSLEQAQAAARQCGLNALAVAKSALESLDRVSRVVRLAVFVASSPHYPDHPKVANGASELMVAVFGERGRHARAAVGCSSLPLNATVEVEVLFEIAS